MRRFDVYTAATIMALGGNIRPEDVDEWTAGTGEPIWKAVPMAVRSSSLGRALVLDPLPGEWGFAPLAAWGCQPTELDDTRQVWFVASREAPRYAIAIHRHFKAAIAEMQPPGFSLRAYSYWRNVKHHRWMMSHGFVPGEVHLSPIGVPYISFLRKGEP